MVIFHSYVSLPEGSINRSRAAQDDEPLKIPPIRATKSVRGQADHRQMAESAVRPRKITRPGLAIF